MRHIAYLAFCFALFAFISASVQAGDILVRVVWSDTKEPVEGAQVCVKAVKDADEPTNKRGECHASGLKGGDYFVWAQKNGSVSKEVPVKVPADGEVKVEVELPRTKK